MPYRALVILAYYIYKAKIMTLVGSVTDNGIGTITFGGITPTSGTITYRNPGSIFDQTLSYSAGSQDIPFLPDGHYVMTVDGADGHIATVTFDALSGNLSGTPIIVNGVTSMAGTAQGRLFKASVSMKEPNGKTFTLSGNGIDAAGAVGELQAKLAIMDSLVTVVSAVRISGNMSAGQITAFNAVNAARTTSGTGYDDADITLLQTFNAGTATQVRETPTLRVRDVRNDLADSGRDDGSVDLGAAEIVALATAYQDPDGNTGYVPYKGRFVLS